MVAGGGLQTILLVSVPFLLPRIISFVTGFFQPRQTRKLIRLTAATKWLIFLLLICSADSFFHAASVANSDLASIIIKIPHRFLTRLKYRDARLLYASFGPALNDCEWCDPSLMDSFLIYVIPTLLGPTLVHAAVYGFVTAFGGGRLVPLRGPSILALVLLAAADVTSLATFNVFQTEPNDNLVFAYRDVTLRRDAMLFVFDIAMTVSVWLFATNRAGSIRPDGESGSEHEQIQDQFNKLQVQLESVFIKSQAANLMHGISVQDQDISDRNRQFWTDVKRQEKAVFEENHVVKDLVERENQKEEFSHVEQEAKALADRVITLCEKIVR
ncbi:hypothetical protein V1514DRAFT_332751 [Lipomyces japonicus]|uniref:uncharacterized protein n=1 Tax=Lipomyces japonicus TaxID=56871 RepID=UPI0034CEA4F7